MLITYISDTHSKHKYLNDLLPGGPMIIHCGDISTRGYEHEIIDFLKWFEQLPYAHRIFVGGNHDFFLQDNPKKMLELLKEHAPNVHYLNDTSVIIEGIKIHGSPIQPAFYNWAFNRERGEDIKKHWGMIHKNTDILITHGPAYGLHDYVVRDHKHVGCQDLLEKIMEVKPKIHACGHIHQGYGKTQNGDTLFINASVLDESYNCVNDPIVVEYELPIIS